MTDFEFAKKNFEKDCRQKKNIANGSKHMVKANRGVMKTPSDFLSAKERKALNGEVMEYSLGQPMVWGKFRAMPADIQVEYVKRLQERFRVPMNEIAAMFGKTKDGFRNHMLNIGYKSILGRGGNHGYDEDGWMNFLEGKGTVNEGSKRYDAIYRPKKEEVVEIESQNEPEGISEVLEDGVEKVYGYDIKGIVEAVRALGGHAKISIEIEV